MEINTVLLTTDFSDTSRAAFGPAIDLAKKYGAKIVVTYVEDDHYLNMVSDHVAVGMDAEHVWKVQHEVSESRLKEFVDANLSGMVKHAEVRRGNPHDEIVRAAREHHADLIVMATHGRGFISHAFMGSTTERVIRSAPCPVLAINVSD
jgi:nucleotide-binding universal stress UspA family protein